MPKSQFDRNHISPKRRAELASFVAERMRALNMAKHTMRSVSGLSDLTLTRLLAGDDVDFRSATLFKVAKALEVDGPGFVQWVREESDAGVASLLPTLEQLHPEAQRIAEAVMALSAEDRRLVEEFVARLAHKD